MLSNSRPNTHPQQNALQVLVVYSSNLLAYASAILIFSHLLFHCLNGTYCVICVNKYSNVICVNEYISFIWIIMRKKDFVSDCMF